MLVASKTEMTLSGEDIMSSKTNASAVYDAQSTGQMVMDKSMKEGAGITINSLP